MWLSMVVCCRENAQLIKSCFILDNFSKLFIELILFPQNSEIHRCACKKMSMVFFVYAFALNQ